MNRKNKIIVVIISILMAVVSLWYFFADDLFLFILSRTVPPAEPMPTEQQMPCGGNPASFVELGSPYEGGKIAEFTTSGNEIYITARKFEHAGIFGSFRGSTAINVGDIDILPTYNEKQNIITNATKIISIKEKDYGALTLPAGRYWLWSSSGGDIVIYSCEEGGVSDPKPVR
jgi:hypothetical protein